MAKVSYKRVYLGWACSFRGLEFIMAWWLEQQLGAHIPGVVEGW